MSGKNRLILTVGLPYSGKTTWAKTSGFPIVSPDAIRLALHGQRFIAAAELWVWAIAHTMVEALFLAGHEVVVLDACNTRPKRRNEWISDKWQAEARVFDVGEKECMRRADEAVDDAILPVIERMAEEWDLDGILFYTEECNYGAIDEKVQEVDP